MPTSYDVNASLPVLLDDGTHKYVWGLGLAFAVDSSGNSLVYHADGLGSVRALTDGSGSVVQTYQYDEYGVAVLSQGSVVRPSADGQRLRAVALGRPPSATELPISPYLAQMWG